MPYTSIDYHRNGSPQKSQWTISVIEEQQLFHTAYKKKWLSESKTEAWGIKQNGENYDPIGRSIQREILYVAKFVSNADNWHGYPADIIKNAHDIPKSNVLRIWMNNSIISKAKATRISRGIPCFP